MPFWITPHVSEYVARHAPERASSFCASTHLLAEAAALAVRECPEGFTIRPLPYSANPQRGTKVDFMALCYQPDRCAGHRSCPKAHACSE
jgi:hypothetical protein